MYEINPLILHKGNFPLHRLGYPFKQNAHYTAGESGRIKKAQREKDDKFHFALYYGECKMITN